MVKLCVIRDIFLNIKSWQKNIAYVYKILVFDIRSQHHIEVDQAKVNKENLFEALEQANLNNFVKLPLKENTIIGEEVLQFLV